MDSVNLATLWYQLVVFAKPSTNFAACQQFARSLLSKTLAFVPTMELRPLSNVIYAMGKLRLDLASEPMGPYLTSHVEERVAELLDKEGFHNEKDIGQLWYGLALCKYEWDSALLTRLAAGTIEVLDEREHLMGTGDVLANMAQLAESISITNQQKEELARAVGVLMDRVEEEPQSVKALAGMAWASLAFELPVPQSLLRRQVKLLLEAPRPFTDLKSPRTGLGHCLRDLSKLGAKPETPAEAQAWFEMLRDITPTQWTLEEVRVGLGTLASCNTYSPSPEAKQMVLDAAASKGVRSAADAGVLLQLSEAWGIALPAEVRARLVRMRGSGGPKP
ncbi:hypothetical protein CHLRE_07g322650v5 [Chlamydomonas reinhardtii]|uniref:Uncharacterized protein n=1 Tax=Chlamydomonas reinhardtii TaxID=3055 RepID=A8I7B3_CHLRE|nr:uncharacterized protein CHLRE_07g322650v5 [Chlamydomonas reinhardtii]PNW80558.1 hypothetical protein CHLRE_07g322650v5 [Chlamydomonas reinhardtii]|eukprot:XP_001700864.1 predicted protein [Chlamydomonas reinhardtii]